MISDADDAGDDAAAREVDLRGPRFANPFAGATTLAATFVVIVATSSANSEMKITIGFCRRDRSWTGSQIGSPKITADADVTATPMNANSVMVVGRPRNWPQTCAR